MFVNCTNHRVEMWSQKQLEEASKYGDIVEMPFPNVSSNLSEEEVKKIGIHTTEDNLAARELYLSAGYELMEIGPCTTADGKERVGYTFQKEI